MARPRGRLDAILPALPVAVAGEWRGSDGPPTLIVAAHPDDETIGLGCQLASLPAPYFLHLTDGAPRFESRREEYAKTRRIELLAALDLSGIQRCDTLQFDVVDQESCRRLADLTRSVGALIQWLEPAVVFTHPYEGGHPDHDSAAFAVHSAVRRLRMDGGPAPIVKEFTSYHNGSPEIDGPWLKVGDFLHGSFSGAGAVETVVLPEASRARKKAMLDCFRTQQQILQWFPAGDERIRVAPAYDFTRPPHAGMLYYEALNWGLTGEDWRRLASEAQRELRVDEGRG